MTLPQEAESIAREKAEAARKRLAAKRPLLELQAEEARKQAKAKDARQ